MKKIIINIILIMTITLISGCSSIRNDEMIKMANVIINNNKYIVNFEDNDTVKDFLKILPNEFLMKELNGNEKYIYLEDKLSSNPAKVGHVSRGDIMLYQDNCLVIFYKSFDTPYSYTKIGHIDDLPSLDTNDIQVKFEI